jgi:hypothetical protein
MTTTSNPLQTVSREAGGTIRAHRFVKDASAGKVVECGVAGEASSGVSKCAADTTDHNEVALERGGEVMVEAGGVVADQALVTTDSQGRAVTAVSGDAILGKVVNGSSASGAGKFLSITFYGEPQEILS